jgi:hypothetical protein
VRGLPLSVSIFVPSLSEMRCELGGTPREERRQAKSRREEKKKKKRYTLYVNRITYSCEEDRGIAPFASVQLQTPYHVEQLFDVVSQFVAAINSTFDRRVTSDAYNGSQTFVDSGSESMFSALTR